MKEINELIKFVYGQNSIVNRLFQRAQNKYKWRKENREELFVSRVVIRFSALLLCLSLVVSLSFINSSEAFSSTWEQTNWDGGVGTSTSSQYSSALGIDATSNGQFSLANTEGLSNTSFNSNLDNWSSNTSEVVPEVIETSIKAAATGTSHALTLRKAPTVGNVLVATVVFNSNPGTITPPTGWVNDAESRINGSATGGRVIIYHRVVQSGDPSSYTFANSTSATVNFSIKEITGVDTTTPVDVTSTVNSGAASTTTTAIPNTAITTRRNSIAVAGVLYVSSSAYTSWSDGFINADATTTWGYTGTKVLTSRQQVTTTFTAVTARQNSGALVVFNGAYTSQNNTTEPGVVQSRSYTTELSHSVTLDSAPTAGNTLILAISFSGNPNTVTVPDGWTQDSSVTNTSSNGRAVIYHKVVGANEPQSIFVTTTAGVATSFSVHEVQNINTSSPVDQTSSVQSAATTSTTAVIPDTATTTSANAFAIARVSMDSTSAFTSWSNSFSNLNSTTNYGYTGTKILSTTQTVGTTFTGVTARRNAAALVVYKASSAPSVVQSKNYIYATGTAFAAHFTNSIVKSNTLIATFNTRTNVGTITPPSGWVLVKSAESASGRGTYIYYKTAGTNESLNQFFNFQYQVNGTMSTYEVRGISTSNPVDVTSKFENISSDPLTFSLATTTNANAFVIGGIGSSTTSGFPVSWATNGYITIYGMTATEFQSGHKIQTSVGTNSLSFTNASLRILQGYMAAFNNAGSYVTSSRDTSTKYSGAASAQVAVSPWSIGRWIQTVNLGDTDTYRFSAKVYSNGDAVDTSIAQLVYNGQTITTNYSSLGSGWYQLSADVTGVNSNIDIGFEIAQGKTVNIDDVSVSRYQSSGTLTSNIFDTERLSNWGVTDFITSGTGNVSVKVRTSNAPDMYGAPNFSSCSAITSGADISSGTNGCVNDAERFIQYQITLTRTDPQLTPIFENIQINYRGADETPPDTNATNISMFKSNGGPEISLNGWTNGNTPYFTWDAALDNAGGIGVAGYCVYLGTDETADPTTTKGLLDTGDLDVRGTCPFATENEYLDTAAIGILASELTTTNAPYYLNIKAIDANDNVFDGVSESFHFRFDNIAPSNPSYINAPSNFISTKTTTMSWETSNGSAPSDSNSGIAGLQYKIGASGTWYGDDHSGAQDNTDLLANDGSYTTQEIPDFDDLVEGNNVVYFRTYDQAGNVSPGSVTTVLKINTAGAPSAPQNVSATPSVNTENTFAFEWLAPATYVGNVNNLTYCYTINVTPTVNNCTYTTNGARSIDPGPYATQPGVNTIYVVAKDESGSINYASYGTAEFTANTAAPGMPLNHDIADTSVRTTSNWRLVISWERPDDVGAGVSNYHVYRSTDGENFTKVGSTGGTSYVDTGLQQENYYYKVRACDSANNCGAFGEIVDETPTGRYTTPPNITSTGGVAVVSNIQTRSAEISWSTDRNSDSKVAFGIGTGQYGSTEAYNSVQTTDHKIILDNLTPGTTYYFVARWTDTDGNTGTTAEQVFITLPPPTVEDVSAIGIGLTSATIQYTTTGASAVKVYYGQTNGFGAVVDSSTSSSKSTYLAQLKDLRDGTKYFYKVNTFDASGYEYDGTTVTFETPPAPKISNLRFQPVFGEPSSTQLVSWDTNVLSTSELSYGIIGGETLTYLDTKLASSHEVIIKDLVDDSTYTLIARSRDANSNLAVSDSQTFKTALDTRPPKITNMTVVSNIRGTGTEARGEVIVSWRTDEPATSQVSYGEGTSGDLNNSSAQDGRLTLDHSVIISDLSTSKVYSIQAISFDKGENKAVGDRQSAIIGRGTDSALGIIFSVLQKIFGMGL